MDIKIVIILSIISGGLELLICKFAKKPIIRFILPIILTALSAGLILYGRLAPLEGMQDLAYMVTGVLVGISAAASLAVAILYSLLHRRGRKY